MGQIGTRGRGLLVAGGAAIALGGAAAVAAEAVLAFRELAAARPLARGWQQAASRDYQDLLSFARPALKIAYEADPAGFAGIWHAETGTDAPDWLTRPGGAPRA